MVFTNLEKLQIKEGINPRLVCADGFWLSVQGDRDKYSHPKRKEIDVTYYESMEIKASELLPQEFDEYLDDEHNCVYGYVPISMIESLLASHGGVV